ncbi:MAG TPA: HD domain-containing protein [Candidatus Limnocylindria bacterium]|nr:HD domain-containing protein [Candidatus Limnocylindria bacterium]
MTVDISPPASVLALMDRLWVHGHAAYVVGGSVRDQVLGREPVDWDLTTDARPDRLLAIFPGAVYENRFGTVAVREAGDQHEVTTFRTDHDYADFRRPHRVEFGDTVDVDLARRDFTVNAIAWGAAAPEAAKTASLPAATGAGAAIPASPTPALVDPFGGIADAEARRLRAVGEPAARFREDALRMIRAVRLAAVLELEIDPPTFAAIRSNAALAAHVSGERVSAELWKLLSAARPSIGLRLLAESGLLDVVLPELAAQRGVPQNKIDGEDLFDHTLRTVDAAPATRPVIRLAALLHDIGKPSTLDDGPFRGHDTVGADLAQAVLDRLHTPRAATERVVHLVRNHMFTYEPEWGDAGIRRFIQRVGTDAIDDLFALREADNVGSGVPVDAHDLGNLRARVNAELAAAVVLDRSRLAVHGDDLMAELGLPAGPRLGRILDDLLDRVIADPKLNDRATLLLLAESMLAED